YGVIRIFSNPLYALANGIGKPSLPFKWTLALLPANVIVLYFMTRHFGLEGVAVGKGFLSLFMVLTLGIELALNIKASMMKMLAQVVPALVSSALMAAAVIAVRHLLVNGLPPSVVTLGVQVVAGAAIYICAVRLFWPADFRKISGVVFKR
ncbi:MAG: polysaccharide biosynthesis C-terminal domain-containing protein, partial [Desulfatitalea sp.]